MNHFADTYFGHPVTCAHCLERFLQLAFIRRQRGFSCPICEHDSWCTISEDGDTVRCMRVESENESAGADGSVGWIHQLSEPVPVQPREESERKPALEPREVMDMARRAFEHPMAERVRSDLSVSLGVSAESLVSLRVGFGCDSDGKQWSSWPSRDADENVIGITRRYENGEKKTMYRTKTGLFFPANRKGLKGPILILEGGSDVAAAFSLGLPAIGRPSNTGGGQWIKKLIGKKRAIVIGENDFAPERRGKLGSCSKDCQGCGNCWPGKFGAELVAKQIGRPWVMPPSGVKDFRELVASGSWWELIKELG